MPTCDMSRCWEFAEEIPGQSTDAFSQAAADSKVHLIAGMMMMMMMMMMMLLTVVCIILTSIC